MRITERIMKPPFFWLSIEDELQISTEKEFISIKEQLINDTGLAGLVQISTRTELIKTIHAFKKAKFTQATEDEFFISQKHKIAFLILKHEGSLFDQELGITRKHYMNKDLALSWKVQLLKEFHPDRDPDKLFKTSDEVTQKVNLIYNRMVGKA